MRQPRGTTTSRRGSAPAAAPPLAAGLVLLLAATAAADVDPLRPFRAMTVEGGFVAGATCVAVNGTSGGGPSGGTIRIAGIPPGATVLEAHLYFTVMVISGPLPQPAPTLNGRPVAPVSLGELDRTPCFPQRRMGAFRADVTGIVTGDGDYVVAGMPADYPTPDPLWGTFTEGATIVAVYCLKGGPPTDVVVYDGFDVVNRDVPSHTQGLQGFLASAAPVAASWLAVVGNGQDFTDQGRGDADPLRLNGTDMETLHPSLEVLSGSACPAGRTAPPINGFWDLGRFDVSSLVPPGSSRATVALDYAEDCYSVVAYVLAVGSARTPAGCGAPYCPLRPGPVAGLSAVKVLPDTVRLAWSPEPASSGGYHVYAVAAKALVPNAPTAWTGECAVAAGLTGCDRSGVLLAAPAAVFYQAVGVCSDGQTEGPV